MEAYLLFGIRSVIALIFLVSAASKIIAPKLFTNAIDDFRLLPSKWSRPLAYLFLSLEALVPIVMLLDGPLLAIGFLLAILLLLIFALALLSVLKRKGDLSCNCFGRSERRISAYDVGRNGFLMILCFIGLWAVSQPKGMIAIPEAIDLWFIASSIVILLLNLQDIVEALRRPLTIPS